MYVTNEKIHRIKFFFALKVLSPATQETATIRNTMMIEIADEVVIGYLNSLGKLNRLISKNNKPIILPVEIFSFSLGLPANTYPIEYQTH